MDTDQEQLQTELGRLSPKERERYNGLPQLRVWYGLRKLTKKAIRKKSICVIYENSDFWNNGRYPERMLHLFHERWQTPLEKIDAVYQTRVISIYDYPMDKGDVEKCIGSFLHGDNNLTEEETMTIEKKLMDKIVETNYL